MILNSPYISGSLTVTGNIISSGSITISGSIASASYASNAERVDGLDSTSFVFTSSYNTDSASVSTRVTKIEGNYATTGSNVFMGAQTVCANITSTGTIIAQTLNVQQVTSSIVYSSGSNTFGNQLTDVQQFTGSVRITGSLNVAGAGCFASSIDAGSYIRNTNSTADAAVTIAADGVSHYVSATNAARTAYRNLLLNPYGCNVAIGTTCPTYRLHVADSGVPAVGVYRDLDVVSVGTAGQFIEFGARCGTTFIPGAAIAGALDNPSTTGILVFQTRCNNSLSSKMTISACGNVGIGTASPTALLHNSRACNSETNIYIENTCTGTGAGMSLYLVENSSTFSPAYGQLTHFNSGYSTNGLLVANRTWLSNSGGELLLGTRSAHDIILHTGGFAAACERMRITSAGVIGVNTNSPSGAYMLTLNGDSSTKTGGISFRQSGTDTFYAGNPSVSNTTDFELWNPRNGYLRLATNNVERLRITSTGAVQNKGTGGTLVTQRLVGCTTAGSSGVDKEIAFVGFNHTINVKALAYQTSDPLSSNVATLTQDIVTSFGNTCKINGGLTCYSNITGMGVGYGTGYKLYLNVTYSGAAPNVLFQIEGISGDTMTLSV